VAYYQITIELSNGKLIQGVRELTEKPIDELWTNYEMKSSGIYRHSMIYFNMVQLSRYSTEVKQYLLKLNPPQPAPDYKALMRKTKNDDRKNSLPDKSLGDRARKG
jgi:hypothetical protein